MNPYNKKIKSHTIEVKKQAKVRESGKLIELDTRLTINFVDDTTVSVDFDYGKFAREYIEREYKRSNSNKCVDQIEMEF